MRGSDLALRKQEEARNRGGCEPLAGICSALAAVGWRRWCRAQAHHLLTWLLAGLLVLIGAIYAHGDRPVLVAGSKLRPPASREAFLKLADAAGYAAASVPAAKGMFPETHPAYAGIYWGPVSWPGVASVVEAVSIIFGRMEALMTAVRVRVVSP